MASQLCSSSHDDIPAPLLTWCGWGNGCLICNAIEALLLNLWENPDRDAGCLSKGRVLGSQQIKGRKYLYNSTTRAPTRHEEAYGVLQKTEKQGRRGASRFHQWKHKWKFKGLLCLIPTLGLVFKGALCNLVWLGKTHARLFCSFCVRLNALLSFALSWK